MTYYVINNALSGCKEYFVPDEATKTENEKLICFVGGETEANAKAQQNKQEFLANEEYRFVLAKEVVEGNNTVWCSVNMQTDPEEGVYQVFNHNSGQYEKIESLIGAKNRLQELKDLFINSYDWSVTALERLPVTTGGFPGQRLAEIPVEVV